MGRIKIRFQGSSMIEAIVASVIFLMAFILSLSTLTGLTIREDEGYGLLEAERALTDCFLRYGDGFWDEGTYIDNFEWGEITTVIEKYDDYENIRQVVMLATLAGSRKTIEYRRLVAKYYE